MYLNTIVFFVIFSMIESAPIRGNSPLHYLSQYGYLGANITKSNKLHDRKVLTRAIADFQSFAGLHVTGELDDETLWTMKLPRCGVKDRMGSGSNSRLKRYDLQGSRWTVKDLKYKISKYPWKLQKQEVDDEIARAFEVWSEYTDLTFQPSAGQAHIEIRFESDEHGDGNPFDGPGETLAHAYFPIYGGDAHFDDSEQWTINSYRGIDLFQVAAHEFGHSLGLDHSETPEALMAPFYRGSDPYFQLDIDDIRAIQAVYGRKTETYEDLFSNEESEESNENRFSEPNNGIDTSDIDNILDWLN